MTKKDFFLACLIGFAASITGYAIGFAIAHGFWALYLGQG